jgi:ribosome recycling factor
LQHYNFFADNAIQSKYKQLIEKQIKDIEKAIMDSDVGITPENNGEIIRLGIPQPTEERRKDLVKQCNKIAEKAKTILNNSEEYKKEVYQSREKAIERYDWGKAIREIVF